MPQLLPPDFSGKILVVRRDNIGDLVCTTPLFAALRKAWPGAHCAALVNSYNAPVLSGSPHVDAVHVYTKFKHRPEGEGVLAWILARLRLIVTLRQQRFAVAMLARPGFDLHGLNLVRLLGIPHVIGFAPDGATIPRALTHPIPLPDTSKRHEVQSIWVLADALGLPPPGHLEVFPDARRVAEQRARLGSARPVIAIHISARQPSRRLPIDKWRHVVAGLRALNPEAALAVFWSPGSQNHPRHPGDDEKAAELLKSDGLALTPMPTVTLPDLVAGLAACDYFIGSDGGALHLAAALGLPTVALFENQPFKLRHWYPWQVRHRMVISPRLEIGDLDPEAIVAAFVELCRESK